MGDDYRGGDTVVFTVLSVSTDYVVSGDMVKIESREAPLELEEVNVYGEGELISEYRRGDWIDELDSQLVGAAAAKAGIFLELSPSGDMRVPGGET